MRLKKSRRRMLKSVKKRKERRKYKAREMVIRVPCSLFHRILLERELDSFKKISIHSVIMKRTWIARGKEEAKRYMARAREARRPDHYFHRKYSEEGLESLRRHVRERMNTPEAIEKRRRKRSGSLRTPVHRKMKSLLFKEMHMLRGTKIYESEETQRVNDYAGVITSSQFEDL